VRRHRRLDDAQQLVGAVVGADAQLLQQLHCATSRRGSA
jgi:hypothetical protein